MTIARDLSFLEEGRPSLFRRWGGALTAVLALHGLAVAGAFYLNSLRSQDGPPPAPIMLTLAPLPAAPSPVETDLPPAPAQVESEPEPEIETPKPEETVKAKDAEIPKPVKRPKRERKPDPPAPATSAPQAAPDFAKTAAAPVAGVSAREADALMSWHARVRAHLERYKRYPRTAQIRGQKGEATLRFAVDRAGRVLSCSLATSSGYELLDEETLAMIRRAEPLPPMPPEVTGDEKVFTIPVQFGLR